MTLLDRVLALFGTNRTRMRWMVRRWQRSWERGKASLDNRTQALRYEHKVCPSCGHPAGIDEQVCTRCGDAMGGRAAHRARKLGALVWDSSLPVVATLLVASIGTMYIVTLVWGKQVGLVAHFSFSPHPLAFIRFGSLFSLHVQDGEWWRLATSMFLHAEPLHLLFNAMSLWSVASYLEGAIGKTKTAALYIALGLVSALVSFWWHVSQDGFGNSVGASGAICGLIGVCIGFTLRHRNGAKHLVGHYAGWALWIGILAFSSWNIDNAGHIGGLVPGVLVGLFVRRKGPASPLSRRLWLTALLVGIAIVLASLVLAALTPLPPEYLEAVAG